MDQEQILEESQDKEIESTSQTDVVEDITDEKTTDTEAAPSEPEGEVEEAEVQAQETTEAPKEPEFQPDYKFIAYGEEKEFDDYVKPLINQENNEKFKELFSKAYAFEKMQTKKESLENKIKEIEPDYANMNKTFELIRTLRDEKDYENLFKILDVPNKDVADHIIRLHKYSNMDPEERALIDKQRDARMENIHYKSLIQEQFEANKRAQFNQHVEQLEKELATPEIQEFVNRYDTVNGQGSFKNFVWSVGRDHFINTGGDLQTGQGGENLTPGQAVQVALKRAMYNPEPRNETVVSQNRAQQQNVSTRTPNALPNIGKGAMSPGKSGVGRISDLIKIRDQLEEAEID